MSISIGLDLILVLLVDIYIIWTIHTALLKWEEILRDFPRLLFFFFYVLHFYIYLIFLASMRWFF